MNTFNSNLAYIYSIILSHTIMAANKNKEFLFFGFYKFFVFCKMLEAKNKKLKFDQIIALFFYFLEYLQKNIEILFLKIHFYGVFMRNLN